MCGFIRPLAPRCRWQRWCSIVRIVPKRQPDHASEAAWLAGLFGTQRDVKVVFQLVTGHEPFAEHVPGVEAGMCRHALKTAPATCGGVRVNLAIGQHGIVNQLPLIPGNTSLCAFVDALILEIFVVCGSPFCRPPGPRCLSVSVSIPAPLLSDEPTSIFQSENPFVVGVGGQADIAWVDCPPRGCPQGT